MKLPVFLLSIFLLFVNNSFLEAQNLGKNILTERPASAAEMSATQMKNIDELCQYYFDKKWLAGGTVLVARKGKIVYFKEWGQKDLEKKTPYQKNDILRLG